ncbi:MAG: glycosyltransferase, partial [Rhodothermales bacterium]
MTSHNTAEELEAQFAMPDDRPRVSIIIVTWNALPLLKKCLPSVAATSYDDLEIIVADNASSDGSA